ncbi:MAG: aspartate/tyrosine/aromatic aminotransferase, partial [Hoeflea sp.]|nr:aspartate/tyrosine/aromatic aminotransferase [Hoeflea sp.]
MARFNPLVQTLAAPPIPEVQAWKREYDGRLGPLIDLSQAVPGYPPHPDMLTWLGQGASSPALAGYGDIAGEP